MSWRRETLNENVAVYSSDAHPFGTDAFLLANFASPRRRDLVCDLGTGCGIIPLIFARDSAAKEVLGVELQPLGIEQFKKAIGEAKTDTVLKAY